MSDRKKPARRPRIEEQKPLAVAKALRMYAETGDLQQAADSAGCHVSTVRRLLTRDQEGFALVKKEIAKRALELSAMAQVRAIGEVGKLDGYRASLVSKISSQQAQELQGEFPGAAVQVNVALALADNLRALEVLKQRKPVVLATGADVVEARQ